MQISEEIKREEKLGDITGVTCIYVPVSDVYKAVHWYQKNLGCTPTDHNSVEPGMEIAILKLPNYPGKTYGPHEAIFLMGGGGGASKEAGTLGFTWDNGDRQAVACFITPRIQEMYNRFKENGVNIVGEIRQ
uniref:VOC family protein n=1 Tax=Paenibacillus terrigena TaxID=369333 RepID=UPI000475CC21